MTEELISMLKDKIFSLEFQNNQLKRKVRGLEQQLEEKRPSFNRLIYALKDARVQKLRKADLGIMDQETMTDFITALIGCDREDSRRLIGYIWKGTH